MFKLCQEKKHVWIYVNSGYHTPELQIRRGIEDNWKIIFLIS